VVTTSPKPEPPAEREEPELAKLVEQELEFLAHHPRKEAKRLQALADEGETAATPLIELARVAALVIPFVLLMIGLMLGVYYLAR
jgi:hypothetical protein